MRRIAGFLPLMLAAALAAGCNSGSSTTTSETAKADATPDSTITKVRKGGMIIRKGLDAPKPLGPPKVKPGL